MSRSWNKAPSAGCTSVCADCAAPDPSWASINRGILLCVQCCSVHRSMGRHISHVKSLRQGTWPPSLLAMVNALTVQNVNSIWEYGLFDSAAPKHLRRKPQPKDALHPTKSEFIQAKHRRLAYVFKPRKDDMPCSLIELNKQLHSSVRSSNLDTSMRLLVQGADPNYFDQEKGTSCLHVACRSGQMSQAELLVVWGADPNTKDNAGNTPSTIAKLSGHIEMSNRMVELVYEVTDRLAYHLYNKKPDHINGQHYISMKTSETSEMSDVAKAARGKLQLLPNHLFEELLMDIYDEVDRRECEGIWSAGAIGLERFGVAFLPVNPALSAPRNQGRQKLARLSHSEIAALLRDVLMDAIRRQHIATLKPFGISSSISDNLKPFSGISDDEPLYDSVASDDDYASLLPISLSNQKFGNFSPKKGDTVSKSYEPSIPCDNTLSISSKEMHTDSVNEDQFNNELIKLDTLKQQINNKDDMIRELQEELQSLRTTVDSLKNENVSLKCMVEKISSPVHVPSPVNKNILISKNVLKKEDDDDVQYDLTDPKNFVKYNQRPTSMYETREGHKHNFNQNSMSQLIKSLATGQNTNDKTEVDVNMSTSKPFPTNYEINTHSEMITKSIQDLWSSMQDPNASGHILIIKADKIKQTVHQLLELFPKNCEDESVCLILSDLSTATEYLVSVCSKLYTNEIRSAAYDVAKATKELVTKFPLEQDL